MIKYSFYTSNLSFPIQTFVNKFTQKFDWVCLSNRMIIDKDVRGKRWSFSKNYIICYLYCQCLQTGYLRITIDIIASILDWPRHPHYLLYRYRRKYLNFSETLTISLIYMLIKMGRERTLEECHSLYIPH